MNFFLNFFVFDVLTIISFLHDFTFAKASVLYSETRLFPVSNFFTSEIEIVFVLMNHSIFQTEVLR